MRLFVKIFIILSVIGPTIGPIQSYFIFYLFFWGYLHLLLLSLNNHFVYKPILPLLMFYFYIVVNFIFKIILYRNVTSASIGGFQAYTEIIIGIIISFYYNQYVSGLKNIVLNYIQPIIIFSILFYIIFPDITVKSISLYAYGVENTGQWRFSSFFGLPYYAAIVYLYFIFENIKNFEKSSKINRLINLSYIIILLIGGFFLVSKTFLIGLAIIILFIYHRSSTRKKIILLIFIPIILIILIIIFNAFFSDDIVSLRVYKLFWDNGLIKSVLLRYSDSNVVLKDLFKSDYWDPIFGIGPLAEKVPTDSQYLDIKYRFGYIGIIVFYTGLIYAFFRLSTEYKFLLLILFLGSLGSNTFTTEKFTIYLWIILGNNLYHNIKGRMY